MKRTNMYLADKQRERLIRRVQDEGVPVAELVRRAADAFLAWDDPDYAPHPSRPESRSHSSLTSQS